MTPTRTPGRKLKLSDFPGIARPLARAIIREVNRGPRTELEHKLDRAERESKQGKQAPAGT